MKFNIEKVREDFPALYSWTYLDNAFVCLMPKQVRDGYWEFLEEWYKLNLDLGETILGKWMRHSNRLRKMIADLVKVKSEEIALTTCTGSGLNIVINGIEWRKGDNIIFPEWEHNAVDTYNTRRHNVELRVWRQRDGKFHISDLESLLDERTRLLQVSQVSYVNGYRMDLSEVTDVAHQNGTDVLVDATQAVGALQVDYKKDRVDYVSVAPYKYLMGPTGLAFLYVSEDKLDELSPDRVGWKNQIWSGENPEELNPTKSAAKFEYGTINFQGVYAFEKGVEYLNSVGMDIVESRVLKLSSYMFDRLQESGKQLFTPEKNKSPIVSFLQENPIQVTRDLMEKMIKVTGRRAHKDHIRTSVHFYNNKNDVNKLLEELV